jgi:hypothetical protein
MSANESTDSLGLANDKEWVSLYSYVVAHPKTLHQSKISLGDILNCTNEAVNHLVITVYTLGGLLCGEYER